MSEKSRWWSIFRRKETTTTVEVEDMTPPPLPAVAPSAAAGAPVAGEFTFLDAPRPDETREAPTPPPDTQPNPTLSTGRLRALGLSPVHVPSLGEQVVLYRLVAQEQAAAHPELALGRWQAVLALCPDDLEARVGVARALVALGAPTEAEAAWRQVLALVPDHAEASGAVGPTELRRVVAATEGE